MQSDVARTSGGRTEIQDGKHVPVRKVHFGYTDGLTVRPPIRGGPERALAEPQPPCERWLFVLLDESENYQLPNPPDSGGTEVSVCSR